MERVRRFKAIIVATIVCSVILLAAVFSVSFAAWQGNSENATAEASGKTGHFYVEYPRYRGGESPELADGTYYIQIPRQSNSDVADYYAMTDHPTNSREKMLTDVYLTVNDKIDLFYGTSRIGIENDKVSNTHVDHSRETKTYTVKDEGYYDFYYEFAYNTMYVGYAPPPSTGDGSGDGETVDTTGYSNPLTVKFSDDATPKTLYFKTADGASGLYADVMNLSVHLRASDYSAYYYNTNTNLDTGATSGDGNMRYVKDAAGRTIDVGTKERTVAFFGFEQQHGTTGSSSGQVYLKDYAVNEINLIELHTAGGNKPVLKSGGSGDGGSSGKTPATPTTSGSAVPGNDNLEDVKTVRRVNASVREQDGTYKYKNYVCVSRATRNSDSIVDNSIAFLEFEVRQTGNVPLNGVNVLGVNITRYQTNDDGSLSGGTVGTPPRLYNFESVTTLDTFGHGAKVDKDSIPGNTIEHYVDGCYCILFFGDGADVYYALDIEIVLDKECDFELTVSASNINNWQRFAPGFGEPWGFYMGGLINNVWLWDPRRTTKMSGTEIDVIYNPDNTVDLTQTKNLESYTSEGSTVYRPKEVDLTLTINLTAGSIAKLYFLNGTGERTGGQAAYFVPKTIKAYPEALFDKVAGGNTFYYDGQGGLLDADDKPEKRENLNIRIPVSGTYTFRYKGSVSERTEYCFINNLTGEYSTDNKLGEPNWYAVSDFNFLIDELTIIGPGATTEDSVVTFVNTDPAKGTLSKTEVTVPFLGKLKASDCPTPTPNTGYDFDKWYADENCTMPYDFDSTVTGDMTLYAKWKGKQYNITFNANGGKIGAENEVEVYKTDTDGYLETLPDDPTRTQTVGVSTYTDYWGFDGWYTEATGGEKIADVASYHFGGEMVLYAQWRQNRFTVTFDYNYVGAPADETCVTDINGKLTAAQLMLPTRSGYTCVGWFTAADDGQGNKVEYDSIYNSFVQDKTLYAHWEESTATVTYYYNDDMHGDAVYMTGSDVSSAPTAPEFAGHSLVGWYTDAACTEPYTFGGSLDADLELYAQWTGAAYTVDDGETAIALTQGVAGTGDKATYSGVIETRDGKDGSIGVGKTVKIYIDGKDVTMLDEANARITHTNGVNSYTIINSEQAKGKFTVRAHLTTTDVRRVDIKFIGGDAADQIGKEITTGSAANAGFYVIGGFSNWSVYAANKLLATDVEGIYGLTLPFVIPNSGQYKIVEVPSSGDLVWYDKNGSGGGSAGNCTIKSTTFYVDTFNKGTSAMFPANIDIYRIIFDKTPITWSSFGTPVQIHYWDKNVQAGSVDISNWDSSGNWKDWNNKNSMAVSKVNSQLYYYDVPAGVIYDGKEVKLTGVIITFKDNSSVLESQNLTIDFEARRSYKYTFANWGSSLNGSWNGTNWWAISV